MNKTEIAIGIVVIVAAALGLYYYTKKPTPPGTIGNPTITNTGPPIGTQVGTPGNPTASGSTYGNAGAPSTTSSGQGALGSQYIAPAPTALPPVSFAGGNPGIGNPGLAAAEIASSGITAGALTLISQQSVTPVYYPGTAIPQNASSGSDNEAFLQGVPGAIASVEVSPGQYVQYTNPTIPPAGTILGTSSMPSPNGTQYFAQVADGHGGSYSVGPSSTPYAPSH